MKITGIKSIEKLGDSINVLVDVDIGADKANEWELTNAIISVMYTKEKDGFTEYMELLDRGIIVHGYEISPNEEKKIIDYLENNDIPNRLND
ncbi:hypothetical protein [Sporosalibacterium faouarense]|uniref:hypothetical protein n=1 Tax=Sporosalibacterium faouarense TaxID=516123 RepID=UPI00141CD814|nr:hypothetical protein [Sporosalibacterium faouarense]MTI48696.1 hypothetical protein [Bacillota bacterium]